MRIEVNCERIRRNTEAIVKMCNEYQIQVIGVPKACCGHPDVARAMLAGGADYLADSRLDNIQRMRDAGIDVPFMLLRLPSLCEVDEVVSLAQISLNSELETIKALSCAAQKKQTNHQVILMVEMGDRREGVMPKDAFEITREILGLANIDLIGLGVNLNCICGVVPTKKSAHQFVQLVEEVEGALGIHFSVVSGGHTSDLGIVARGEMPHRVNQLRIGGGILKGTNTADDYPLPFPHRDVFTITGEVIEIKIKPSMPEGKTGKDALGRAREWRDLGLRRRAILAMGEQDVRVEDLVPKRRGVTLVGASSDHTVVDVTDATPPVKLGDWLEFTPGYAGIASAMASRTVKIIMAHENDSIASS